MNDDMWYAKINAEIQEMTPEESTLVRAVMSRLGVCTAGDLVHLNAHDYADLARRLHFNTVESNKFTDFYRRGAHLIDLRFSLHRLGHCVLQLHPIS
jgi:hypothetical protein